MSEPVATLPPAAPSAEVPLASRVFDTGILVLGVGSVLYALVNFIGTLTVLKFFRYRHLGVDYHAEYLDHTGRPRPVLPFGTPIAELF